MSASCYEYLIWTPLLFIANETQNWLWKFNILKVGDPKFQYQQGREVVATFHSLTQGYVCVMSLTCPLRSGTLLLAVYCIRELLSMMSRYNTNYKEMMHALWTTSNCIHQGYTRKSINAPPRHTKCIWLMQSGWFTRIFQAWLVRECI